MNRVKPIAYAAIDGNRYSEVVLPVANPYPTAMIRVPRHTGIDPGDLPLANILNRQLPARGRAGQRRPGPHQRGENSPDHRDIPKIIGYAK